MKSVKLTFGSLVLVAMLVVSLVSSGFSQTVLAGNITIKATSNMYHAEVYSVITRLKSDGGLEVLSQGPVTNGAELSATIDSSEKVCFIFFGKPEKGYLITGAGTGGKGNMSHISELRDPAKLGRTEAKVPEEILQKMEQEGYLIAWGYTRGNGQGNGKINDSVDGFKPSVISSIRNTSGEIEPGKPITMEIVIRPDKAFRRADDQRKYWTSIPEGEATVTIDGKKVLPVTGITKENENLYKGTISFVLGDEDASVNTHTAVVNANVHYTAELALSKAGSAYSGEPVKTTTVVEAPPATVSFSLISGPSRKLMYDLNYEGAETIEPEYHDSGTSVTVRPDIYVRPGYEFGGWDTLDSQGNAVNRKPSDTFIMPDRVTGTKLIARWRPYLTVDCANGSAVYSVPYEVGSLATPIRPLKKDYYFSGWKVDNGKQYGVSEDIIMPDKPLKITATWYNTISSIIKPAVNAPVIPDEKAEDKPAKKTVADNNTEKKPSQGKKSETESKAEKKSEKKSEKKPESKAGNKKASSSKSETKNTSESKTEKKKASESKVENKKSSEKKSTESKTENKKTSESKSEKKSTESKTENKKTSESKSEKKPTESKTETKKTSESKSEKKSTESKTENKKTSESKSEKKSTESKTENKKTSESKSEKKSTESKTENKKTSESKSEKKPTESKPENKKSQEGKADTGRKDIGKTDEAGNGADGTKEGTTDSGSDGKKDVAPDETAESPENKENTDEITEETKEEVTDKDEAEKEETEKENTDKDAKKKETSDKEESKKNSDSKPAKKESSKKEPGKEANKDSDKKESSGKDSGKESSKESGKKESTDKAYDKKDGDSTESGKKDNSSAESGNKASSSNDSGKKGSSTPESGKRGGSYTESGNNGGLASQSVKENVSVSASGKLPVYYK